MIKKPMLAATLEDVETVRFPVLATPKIDGIRCLIREGQAVSRTLKPIPNSYIRHALSESCFEGYDGEIVIPHFPFNLVDSVVMSRKHEMECAFKFMVFDIFDGNFDMPYRIRMKKEYISCQNQYMIFLFPVECTSISQLTAYMEQCLRQGYEGICFRQPDSPYKFGRSTAKEQYLMKWKPFVDEEATVIGFEELQHNENIQTTNALGESERSSHQENKVGGNTLGALVVYSEKWGTFKIGTGFSAEDRFNIWHGQYGQLGRKVTFKYLPYGSKDKPRHPVFLRWRNEI